MMDLMSWTLIALALFSTAGVVYSLFWIWTDFLSRSGTSVSDRLSALSPSQDRKTEWRLLKHRDLSRHAWMSQQLERLPYMRRLDLYLQQTGWQLRVEHILLACLLACTALGLITAVTEISWLWAPGLIAVTLMMGGLSLQYQRTRRRRQIEGQLPDALDLIARAMQAGHALSSAILVAATEGPQPLSDEMRAIFDEIHFGIETRTAIEDFSHRVDSEYVRLFVVSALVQMDTGGNMAEILKNTAHLIRQRQQMQASVRVLSAEARVSALILSVLPFGLAALLALINPGFISLLWTDPLGVQLLIGALALMGTGIFWMWRMIDISV